MSFDGRQKVSAVSAGGVITGSTQSFTTDDITLVDGEWFAYIIDCQDISAGQVFVSILEADEDDFSDGAPTPNADVLGADTALITLTTANDGQVITFSSMSPKKRQHATLTSDGSFSGVVTITPVFGPKRYPGANPVA